MYKQDSPLTLNGLSDASYASCSESRRSFAGYLFKLGEAAISWKSRKQRTVALSTCEAEYMALSLASRQFTWLVRGLHQLIDKNIPALMLSDNRAAIDLAYNPRINYASKHIEPH